MPERTHATPQIARLLLALLFLVPNGLSAEDHIVTSADLRKEAVAASQARQENLNKVEKFFSSESAQKALKSAAVDGTKVRRAVSSLNDAELARLAQRTDQVQADVSAGALSNQDLTYIVIALAAAVLVLVIVAS